MRCVCSGAEDAGVAFFSIKSFVILIFITTFAPLLINIKYN
ncbi:hypothetical protein BN938_0208 [Mucinivorans hirudinis]|uniref:Uncharacterized protein n=1 Tax=Mucinivorans hirudinis TaxID=1433126 RepID=A0A060RAA0_9BACT|nr:hypothetical protein BN938_0208 [Mucinivorans hirudinis]